MSKHPEIAQMEGLARSWHDRLLADVAAEKDLERRSSRLHELNFALHQFLTAFRDMKEV